MVAVCVVVCVAVYKYTVEFTCLVPPAQVHNLPVLFELIFKSVQNDSEVHMRVCVCTCMCACVVTSLQWKGSFGRYIIAHVLALIKVTDCYAARIRCHT